MEKSFVKNCWNPTYSLCTLSFYILFIEVQIFVERKNIFALQVLKLLAEMSPYCGDMDKLEVNLNMLFEKLLVKAYIKLLNSWRFSTSTYLSSNILLFCFFFSVFCLLMSSGVHAPASRGGERRERCKWRAQTAVQLRGVSALQLPPTGQKATWLSHRQNQRREAEGLQDQVRSCINHQKDGGCVAADNIWNFETFASLLGLWYEKKNHYKYCFSWFLIPISIPQQK